jgi:O-antigen/teichoic acid export membrane protein
MAEEPEIDPIRSSLPDASTSRQHIRGSWLLVAGRVLNVGVDFVAQILIVRYLSTSSYGAFAYALSVVSLTTSVATLGLDKAIGRFVPIYDEQGDHGRLLGAWLLVGTTVLLVGFAMVPLLFGLESLLRGTVMSDEQSLALLLILIVTSPLNAFGAITSQMLATFASPMLILIRTYLVLPLLQVGVVLLVIWSGSGVELLAFGWVATVFVSAVVSLALLVGVLRARGLLRREDFGHLRLPARDVLLFGLPLFASNVVFQLRLTGAVVMLEALHGTADVGLFRAAVPLARQNLLLFETFSLLFTPLAARLFARRDWKALNEAYWQSAIWIAVATVPLFIVAFGLAEPLSVFLYGERYRGSGPILAVLTLGFYVSAAIGFNEIVLRIFGRVGAALAIDAATTALGLGLGLILIGRFGAVGAAATVSAIMIAQKLLYHFVMRTGTGIRLFDPTQARVYIAIALGAGALFAFQSVLDPPFVVGLVAAGVISLAVLLLARTSLRIGHVFPELRTWKLVGWVIRD